MSRIEKLEQAVQALRPDELAEFRAWFAAFEAEQTNNGSQRGERMAAALAKLAKSSGLRAIKDPVLWQREMREDRSLPGRDR